MKLKNFIVCYVATEYIHYRETWRKQRSELWRNLMSITNSKSKSRKPLPKMSCSGTRSPMFANCIHSQFSGASRSGFTSSSTSLKRPASEDLSGAEYCSYSSESEDDEENRQRRSSVIQIHQAFSSSTWLLLSRKHRLVSIVKCFESFGTALHPN